MNRGRRGEEVYLTWKIRSTEGNQDIGGIEDQTLVLSGVSLFWRALCRYRQTRQGPGKPEKGREDVPGDGTGLLASPDAGGFGEGVEGMCEE